LHQQDDEQYDQRPCVVSTTTSHGAIVANPVVAG
jgi:hypothetical protein